MHKLLENVEKELKAIADKGITSSNLETTYKLIDIYKDLAERDYYKEVTNAMREGGGSVDNYGRMEYDAGRSRDSRGRYNDGGYNGYDRGGYNGYQEYDRRGSGRYSHLGPMERHFERLEDEMDNYNASRNRYRNGGSQERVAEGVEMVMEAIHKMVECIMDYAETPQEKEIVRKHIEKMKSM